MRHKDRGLIALFVSNRPTIDGAMLAMDEINAAGGVADGGARAYARCTNCATEGTP